VSTIFNKRFSREASVEKMINHGKKPYLIEVADLFTGTDNQVITKNNIVTIYGERLKFDATQDEYLKFINAENPSEFVVVTICQKITDKEIVFLMPEVSFMKGYFEIGSRRGTLTMRTGKSQIMEVK
jgi:hypothetical protein